MKFKKSFSHFRSEQEITNRQLIQMIHLNHFQVFVALKFFNIPESTYHAVINHVPSNHDFENQEIQKQIMDIYVASRGIYVAPKIRHELMKLRPKPVGIKRVQYLMRDLNIHSVVIKKYKAIPNNYDVQKRVDLLDRVFTTERLNQVWTADITYIGVETEGWTYLATVMDLHFRGIIGYGYGHRMDTQLVTIALGNAIINRKYTGPIIMHIDNGSQYTSDAYEEMLRLNNMQHSYSEGGDPYDNSVQESFHSILKKEEVYRTVYHTFEDARIKLFQYIENWYNRSRIHGSLSYLTPVEFEKLIIDTKNN